MKPLRNASANTQENRGIILKNKLAVLVRMITVLKIKILKHLSIKSRNASFSAEPDMSLFILSYSQHLALGKAIPDSEFFKRVLRGIYDRGKPQQESHNQNTFQIKPHIAGQYIKSFQYIG